MQMQMAMAIDCQWQGEHPSSLRTEQVQVSTRTPHHHIFPCTLHNNRNGASFNRPLGHESTNLDNLLVEKATRFTRASVPRTFDRHLKIHFVREPEEYLKCLKSSPGHYHSGYENNACAGQHFTRPLHVSSSGHGDRISGRRQLEPGPRSK